AAYDPQLGSQAFSLIGFSGTTAGGSNTEDRRFDNSLKYVGLFGPVHVGLEYKFNGASGETNTAYQFQLGAEYLGASVDAYFAKTRDAVGAAPLSAAQVAQLPGLGFSVSNSLAGTISDNTAFVIVGRYNFGATKLYGGYEHVSYANPEQGLPVGF